MKLWMMEIYTNCKYEDYINRLYYEDFNAPISIEFLKEEDIKIIIYGMKSSLKSLQYKIISFFSDFLSSEDAPKFKYKIVEDKDWNDVWKSEFNCIEINKSLAIKPHFKVYNGNIETILTINPSIGFGSGEHPTTQLMLEKIIDINIKNKTILDIGSGSGILSIASLLFGADNCLMIEIDGDAGENSKENFTLNNIINKFNLIIGDFSDPLVRDKINIKFDIIFMNILPNIIIDLLPYIRKFMNDNGIFIISGVINDRFEEISNILKLHRFKVNKHQEKNNWIRLDCSL